MAYKNDKTKNRRRYKSRYRSAHSYKQQRSSSQTKAAVLVSVLTFVVIASLVVVFTFGDSIYVSLNNLYADWTATEAPTQTPTEAPTEAPTQAPTDPPTQAPTDPPVEQEDQFMQLLELNNLDLEDIKVSQMIFVDADEENLTCKVYCYEKDSTGLFVQNIGPFDGYIGSEGIDATVGPYEYKTPTGLFKVEYTFGTRSDPGTAMEYTQFTSADYWITDPNSVNYNRWMNVTDYSGDWETSQWLFEYTVSYPYAIVFNYNRDPVDPTQGCAKFIHVSYSPTKGGIGISENDILSMLYWMKPSAVPYVAISK